MINLEDIKVGTILEIEFSRGTKEKYLVLSVSKGHQFEEFYFKLFNITLNKIYNNILFFNNEHCAFKGKMKIIWQSQKP